MSITILERRISFRKFFHEFLLISISIHFNLNQREVLAEVQRVLKDFGYFYITYLAPGHKFIERSTSVGENLIEFNDDHYVPKMRKMVMKFYDDSTKIKTMYQEFFDDVRVTKLEYNILDAPNAYWIVTGKNT